jgi:hypothetical protein
MIVDPAVGMDAWCFDMSLAPRSKSVPVSFGHDVTGVYLMLFCPDEANPQIDMQAAICIGWWEPHMPNAKGDPRGRWQGEAGFPVRPTAWRHLPKAPTGGTP